MYKICKTEGSALRQRMLENTLLEAMGAKPYSKITISALCQQAGIPRKAFYRYFSTMDDALLALIDHTLAGCNGMTLMGWDGSDRFSVDTIECFFSYWLEQKPFLDALTANGFWPKLLERTIIFINRQKTGLEQPEIGEHYEQDLPEYFVAAGLMSTVLRWYSHGYPSTPRRMAEAAAGLLAAPGIPLTRLLI